MKKILLIAIGAFLAGTAVNAQNLKQSGNEKNLQVLFAPLGGQPISIDGISFRKFNATGTSAWRLNLFIGYSSDKSVISQADTGSFATGGGRPETDAKKTSMTFGIRPGYEMHMAGTDRLSPYWGGELLFSLTTAKVDSDHVITTGNPPSGWSTLTTTSKGDGGMTTFGLNIIFGCDYYIAKSLSLGAEFGFGFSATSKTDLESQYIDFNATNFSYTVKDAPKAKQGSSFQVGPNAVGQLKLGWLF